MGKVGGGRGGGVRGQRAMGKRVLLLIITHNSCLCAQVGEWVHIFALIPREGNQMPPAGPS